jgi:Helix-turn-helix domain
LYENQPLESNRVGSMPGPSPIYRPDFPDDFVEQARNIVRQWTVAYQLRQRATLVLLLHADPCLSNVRAAAQVRLHPNAVRYWRRRWAQGEFGLEDAPGRGRKVRFSPSGPRPRESQCV